MHDDEDSTEEDIESQNRFDRYLVIYSDLVYTIFLIIWMAVFKCYARHKAVKIENVTLTTVDYSVTIHGFPRKDISREELKLYLESHFGPVAEVTFSR